MKIPKKMSNEESKLVAAIIADERVYLIAKAKYLIAKAKLAASKAKYKRFKKK